MVFDTSKLPDWPSLLLSDGLLECSMDNKKSAEIHLDQSARQQQYRKCKVHVYYFLCMFPCFMPNILVLFKIISSVLVAQSVKTPAGLTYVLAKGRSDRVRDQLSPRNSFQ